MSLITSIAHFVWVALKVFCTAAILVSAAVLLLIALTMAWYRLQYLWARWRWHRAAQRRIKLELLLLNNPFTKPERIMKESLR